ncbi:MAG: helix-turn-helix domain-containing protein [Nitrospinae bacterium]|nr:helix-turn-helix domain-containing protein [Nitrospinota bacterium]
MTTIGGYLTNKRKRKKIELERIARETKIKQHHLESLEKDNLNSLPGDIYIKGFIKNYMKTLSLNDSEALRIYEAQKNRGTLEVLSGKLEEIIYGK